MKRFVAVQCLLLSLGLIPAISLLWCCSLLIDLSDYHYAPIHNGSYNNHINIILLKNNVFICNRFQSDHLGHVVPWIDHNMIYSVPTRNRRGGDFTIPGLGFRYGQLNRDGDVAWSFRFSLAFPLFLSMLSAALLRRYLRSVRG